MWLTNQLYQCWRSFTVYVSQPIMSKLWYSSKKYLHHLLDFFQLSCFKLCHYFVSFYSICDWWYSVIHGSDIPIKHAISMIVAAILETQHVLWSCRREDSEQNIKTASFRSSDKNSSYILRDYKTQNTFVYNCCERRSTEIKVKYIWFIIFCRFLLVWLDVCLQAGTMSDKPRPTTT